MKDQLKAQIHQIGTGSVLFLGSGISRRYISLPTWEALLAKFSICGKEFGYYRSAADGSLPLAASMLAEDFHKLWWNDDRFKASRSKYESLIKNKADPLKYEIAEFIQAHSSLGTAPEITAEVALLKNSCVDAIITTNWDCLLEGLFPEFRVFSGQDELLFANPSMIAEIYKIHGSCTKPPSMVATKEDYTAFEERNPYLASKLLTIFLEHPIIFFGYSLTDTNIGLILDSIVRCMGTGHLNQLQNRLFFVEWSPDTKTPTMSQSVYRLNSPGSAPLPITLIQTSSFLPVFEALQEKHRKIPLRILRYCKEQLYELVHSNAPGDRLCVLPFEDSPKLDRVEFVVGVGASNAVAAGKGYAMISRRDLIEDYLFDWQKFDPKLLLQHTLPVFLKSSKYTPVLKYLHAAGIKTHADLKTSGLLGGEFQYPQVKNHFYRNHLPKIKDLTLEELVASYDEMHVLHYIPVLLDYKLDPTQVIVHLRKLLHLYEKPNSRTIVNQAICACDQAMYKLT
jgi:hypothetical protein